MSPNVIWICADDFTPDVLGDNTPTLQRLAAAGTRFDRAYCTCPLSTPSRQSFWTGRYPRSIGVTLSPTPLPDDETTLPVLLRAAGYEVAAFGKTHFYSPRPHEFDLCVDWSDHRSWLLDRETRPLPPNGRFLGPWKPFFSPASEWLNADCLPYPAFDQDMTGTFLAQQASEYLARPKSRPFFVYVSFYETHSPFRFPIEYDGRIAPRSFVVPRVGRADRRRLPDVFRKLTRKEKQGILAAYSTSAMFMDKNVRLVLDAVDRCGLADNTLVLFTSDHGYMLGQHGRFEKHCCFEPAVRSALMMRFPGVVRGCRTSDALIELIDLVPTILELCDVPIPSNVQGRSLMPLMRGLTDTHRERVVAEYADNEEAMIRSDRWKLIYTTGARRRGDGYAGKSLTGREVQLFDIETDPQELHNLANEPKHADLVQQLKDELASHMVQTTRMPEAIPESGDADTLLSHCLSPKDSCGDEWPGQS